MQSRRNNKYARGVAKYIHTQCTEGIDLSLPFACGIEPAAATSVNAPSAPENAKFDSNFFCAYINLDSAQARREYMELEFAKSTGLSSIIEREEAVVGLDLVIPPVEDTESELGKFFSNPHFRAWMQDATVLGNAGCSLSHMHVLRRFLDTSEKEFAMVLEGEFWGVRRERERESEIYTTVEREKKRN